MTNPTGELETHFKFMRAALRLANNALHNGEVPVACVFVHNDEIISYGMNNTNDSLSGITHAEFKGINTILSKLDAANHSEPSSFFKEVDLYVTVEPCVMCASALKQIGIRSVYFGCGNERFGGNGSVLRINTDVTTPENNYQVFPGVYRREAILLLREFYIHENSRAPIPRSKKNRNFNTETYPEIVWSNYLTKDQFVRRFGDDLIHCFNDNKDIIEEVDLDILDGANTDITDIQRVDTLPLKFPLKKQRIV